MAKRKAADVAEDLKGAQAASKPKACQTPAKGVVSRSNNNFMIQAFGVMNIPAKSYKATDTDKLETKMYHSADCVHTLKQGYTCTGCNEEVQNALTTAVRGVEMGDKVVLVSKEEMESAKPASDKVLKITSFVPEESINVIYYESSEFIAADKGGEKAFATFQQGLATTGRVAIGTIVSRGHQYTVAIRPYGQHGLVMSYLFADYEVRECGKWSSVQTNPAEVELVKQLMTETELAKDAFTPAEYDPYLANMRSMIEKKMNGETVTACDVEEEPKEATNDLLAALQATLNQAAKKKAAKAGN
jgi:DNA end-binding protein Ku